MAAAALQREINDLLFDHRGTLRKGSIRWHVYQVGASVAGVT
jgi:hypothetical protein